MASIEKLPVELMAQIGRHLNRRDLDSLSKTNRIIRSHVQHVLYETIAFTYRREAKVKDLLLAFLARPHLGKNVRTIITICPLHQNFEMDGAFAQAMLQNASLITQRIRQVLGDITTSEFQLRLLKEVLDGQKLACFALIVTFTRNVQSIIMRGRWAIDNILTDTIRSMLQTSNTNDFLFPNLKRLTVAQCVSFPLIAPRPLTSLKLIQCEDIQLYQFNQPSRNLTTLHIRGCEISASVIAQAFAAGTFRSLRDFSLRCLFHLNTGNDIDYRAVISNIATYSPGLKSLDLIPNTLSGGSLWGLAQFKHFKELQNLNVECGLLVDHADTALEDIWLQPLRFLPENLRSFSIHGVPFDRLVELLILGVECDFGPSLTDLKSRIPPFLTRLHISVVDEDFRGRGEVNQVLGYVANELFNVGLRFLFSEAEEVGEGEFEEYKVVGPGFIRGQYEHGDI